MTYDLMIFGIVISILFYEITGISPGGIVVPGYIALFLNQPQKIGITLFLGLITLGLVNVLSEYTILYGKRKFAVMVIVSFVLKALFKGIIDYLSIPFDIVSIGYIVPGLLAKEMDRQGVIRTIASMIIAACMVKLGVVIMKKGILP
ncbi:MULTISPECIES: poly-gamma-glutamate biosynthesis protein PgsC [Tepidanaerobacter]|uniref:poly-gamma-glutamate biosynthesis protein PgsC n=1 Tax=Tepidanaerobacter TaxID=499228 RepID=UPI000A7DCF47|nr:MULTISPECIES: poly-gamma-glutamate biosynthesis protein PgsC [Tepidanaerobacter]